MAVPTFQVSCTSKRRLTHNVYELRFTRPASLQFSAGQFLLFQVPSLSDLADLQPRAYSIASAPGEKELIFIIKLVPEGRASTWVQRALKPGTVVTMQGPLGSFVVDRTSPRPFLFVATGTGAAPLRSQIRHLLQDLGEERTIDFVFGGVSPKDLFWEDEWKELSETYPQFHYHVCLLNPGSRTDVLAGAVEKILPTIIPSLDAVSGYFCGSPAIVSTLRKHAVAAWAMPEEHVHWEKFV